MAKKSSIDLTKNKLNYIYVLLKGDTPFYIGKTHYPKRREREHKQKYGNDIKMAILKAIKDESWKGHEKEWIQILQKWGIELDNLNPGGGGPIKGTIRSKEFGEKISKTKKGVSRDKKEVIPATLAKQKSVLQFNKNGEFIQEFPSAKIAASYLNIHPNTFYDHLKGRYKTAKGYIFKYKE
jgi:hypothetical protein